MKKIIYLLLLLYWLPTQAILAQDTDLEKIKELLIGYWNVEDKGTLIIESTGEIFMHVNGEIVQSATWKLSEDGVNFYIMENGEIEETMEILEITETVFAFKSNSTTMLLNRTDPSSILMPDDLTIEPVRPQVSLSSEELKERKRLLVGNWAIEGEGTLVIQENGVIQEKKDGEIQHEGTWKLSEEGTTFYILENGEVEEELIILDITEEKLIGESKNGKDVTLFREKPVVKVDVKARKKFLIGTWETNVLDAEAGEGSEPSLQLIIKKDGTVTSVRGEEFKKEGRWTLSEDGVYLVISSEEGSDTRMRIVSVDKENMQLFNRSQKFDFIRIK
jgi:hypothetical protein